MKFSIASFGVPVAVVFIWQFGQLFNYNIIALVFLVAMAFGAALLWGVLMWELFIKNFRDPPPEQKPSDSSINER